MQAHLAGLDDVVANLLPAAEAGQVLDAALAVGGGVVVVDELDVLGRAVGGEELDLHGSGWCVLL
jgi:hypothetical protein